jgi:hypothetical protein
VGADDPVTSCDVHVLVDKAAELVSSLRTEGRCGIQTRTALVNRIRDMSEILTGWPSWEACTILSLPM